MAWITAEQLKQVEENSANSSSYINLNKLPENKEHRFRAFGEAKTGWQGWIKEDGKAKPIRWELKPETLPANLEPFQDGSVGLQFFVTSLFWDYTADRFGIMLVTQKTVYEKFAKYESDPDYGDCTGYDIKITRTVKNDRTSYDVIAAPPKPVAKSIEQAYADFYCDLNALYDNEDPFKDPALKAA